MKLSPRAWPLELRATLSVVAGILAFAAVLWVKRALLLPFVSWAPWSGLLAFAALAAAMEGARGVLGGSPLATWAVGVPLLAVLVVLLVNTPLPYEMAHVAEGLPHPEGTVRATVVETMRGFVQGHPTAIAVFRYPPERSLVSLTEETRFALERDGWDVASVKPAEGESETDFSVVTATKRGFLASCTLGTRGGWVDWEGPMRTVGCRVTV